MGSNVEQLQARWKRKLNAMEGDYADSTSWSVRADMYRQLVAAIEADREEGIEVEVRQDPDSRNKYITPLLRVEPGPYTLIKARRTMKVCPKCRDYTRELVWGPWFRCLSCGNIYRIKREAGDSEEEA